MISELFLPHKWSKHRGSSFEIQGFFHTSYWESCPAFSPFTPTYNTYSMGAGSRAPSSSPSKSRDAAPISGCWFKCVPAH